VILPPIDTATSQDPDIAPEPEYLDHCGEHLSRIADLEGQVRVLKQQVIAAMDQAKKLVALSQKVSSLEDQMSVLMVKIIQPKECDLYMTKIIEAASEQLLCKSLGALECSCRYSLVLS
jgi:hypothetical protein